MALVPNTITNNDPILKQLFDLGPPAESIQAAGPTWAQIRQVPAGGKSLTWTVRDSLPQSRGNSMPGAIATANIQNILSYSLPSGQAAYPQLNAAGEIAQDLIQACLGAPNEKAFADDLMYIINGSQTQHMTDCAIYLWNDGSGALGQVDVVDSGSTPKTITLKLYTDGNKFFRNGTYASATAKYGSPPTNGQVCIGRSIDTASKTATLQFTTLPSGVATGDYLFAQNVYATAVGTGAFLGIPAYIPGYTTPSDLSTTFLTVNRSLDPQMSAGFSVDGTNKSLTQSITELAYSMSLLSQRGAQIVMNPMIMKLLQNEMGNSIVRLTDDQSGISLLGFEKFRANFMGAGSFDIYQDLYAPGDKAYILDLNSFEFRYTAVCASNPSPWGGGLGMNTGMLHPGIPLFLKQDDQVWQYRIFTYGQIVCTKPSTCGVITGLVP